MRTIALADIQAAADDELRSYAPDYSAGPIRWLPEKPRGPRVPRRRAAKRRAPRRGR